MLTKKQLEDMARCRYYPYGLFCDKYGCWCDDVVEITDGENECNGDCKNCDCSSEPWKG